MLWYVCMKSKITKKCPFCGGYGILYSDIVSYKDINIKLFNVGCLTSGCYHEIDPIHCIYKTQQEAIDAWENRKTE